jgi:hypothetical protein
LIRRENLVHCVIWFFQIRHILLNLPAIPHMLQIHQEMLIELILCVFIEVLILLNNRLLRSEMAPNISSIGTI